MECELESMIVPDLRSFVVGELPSDAPYEVILARAHADASNLDRAEFERRLQEVRDRGHKKWDEEEEEVRRGPEFKAEFGDRFRLTFVRALETYEELRRYPEQGFFYHSSGFKDGTTIEFRVVGKKTTTWTHIDRDPETEEEYLVDPPRIQFLAFSFMDTQTIRIRCGSFLCDRDHDVKVHLAKISPPVLILDAAKDIPSPASPE